MGFTPIAVRLTKTLLNLKNPKSPLESRRPRLVVWGFRGVLSLMFFLNEL